MFWLLPPRIEDRLRCKNIPIRAMMPKPLKDIRTVTEFTAISISWSFIISSLRFVRGYLYTLTQMKQAKLVLLSTWVRRIAISFF